MYVYSITIWIYFWFIVFTSFNNSNIVNLLIFFFLSSSFSSYLLFFFSSSYLLFSFLNYIHSRSSIPSFLSLSLPFHLVISLIQIFNNSKSQYFSSSSSSYLLFSFLNYIHSHSSIPLFSLSLPLFLSTSLVQSFTDSNIAQDDFELNRLRACSFLVLCRPELPKKPTSLLLRFWLLPPARLVQSLLLPSEPIRLLSQTTIKPWAQLITIFPPSPDPTRRPRLVRPYCRSALIASASCGLTQGCGSPQNDPKEENDIEILWWEWRNDLCRLVSVSQTGCCWIAGIACVRCARMKFICHFDKCYDSWRVSFLKFAV